MKQRGYGDGFAAGLLIGAASAGAAWLATSYFSRFEQNTRVLRVERSMQIGRPVGEVFRAWSDYQHLARVISFVERVEQNGTHTHWRANLGGAPVEWDAEVTQFIDNEAIGWKSVHGPKHTGRVSFSPIGEQTLVLVTMNLSPAGRFSRALGFLESQIESKVEEALRDFKKSLEGKGGQEHVSGKVNQGPGSFASHGSPIESSHQMPLTSPTSADSAAHSSNESVSQPDGFNTRDDSRRVHSTTNARDAMGPAGPVPIDDTSAGSVNYTRPPEGDYAGKMYDDKRDEKESA